MFQRQVPLNSRDHGNGAIFICGGLSIALIWARNSIFPFDSHARNKEGCLVPHGKAVLLEFSLLGILNRYLQSYYSINYSGNLINLQYDLQYIQVNISEESKQVTPTNVDLAYI